MTDVVDRNTRSRMMSGIRGRDTKPEILVRKGLFSRGFRFRLHDKSLPGRPDVVIKKHRVAVLIHGCFWHHHDGCPYFRLPSTNTHFWKNKLLTNRQRDAVKGAALLNQEWRLAVVWECALRTELGGTLDVLSHFISGNERSVDISMNPLEAAPAIRSAPLENLIAQTSNT